MKRSLGFSLLELMVTLAVAGVLTVIAIPALTTFVQDNAIASGTNQFLAAVNFARNTAITTHQPVVLCWSTSTATTPACNNTGADGYEDGWVIFTDPDGNGASAGGDVLRRGALEKVANVTLRGSANVANHIRFSSLGALVAFDTSNNGGQIVVCDQRGWKDSGAHAQVIDLATSGRVKSIPGNDTANVPAANRTCTP